MTHSNPPKRVLLVSMPWASPRFPSLGVALLRSILTQAGIATDALYGNLPFSRLIGGDAFYEEQLAELPIAETVFSPYYFDGFAKTSAARALHQSSRDLGGSEAGRNTPSAAEYLKLIDTAGVLLDELVEDTDWSRYDIVGFSVMMQQTVPSLALAKRIKQLQPDMSIVFGGPNCSAPMGEEIARAFLEVDFVVEGEADLSLLELVRRLRDRPGDCLSVPGIITSVDVVVRHGPPARLVDGLDDLPLPDFRPFFEQLETNALTHVRPYVLMEASRGCWWGEKHHCTFCSLEDRLMKYRSKSPDRVIGEVIELSMANKRDSFFLTDSIVGHQYYKSLLPTLARHRDAGHDWTFFFEAKSNMRRDHARKLRDAGAAIVQPGIESLSDHVLSLMNKGATGIQQLQCLKFLAEAGVTAYWNLLTGTPGETVDDYDETVDMIQYMHHLPPLRVGGVIPMLLMRFSPYEQNPDRYGIRDLTPLPAYRFIFPRGDIDINKLAYYFTYVADQGVDSEIALAIGRLEAAVLDWRSSFREDALTQMRSPGRVEITDRRRTVGRHGHVEGQAERKIVLHGIEAEIFVACDEVTTERSIIETFSQRESADAIGDFLRRMIHQRLMFRARNGRLLNLPLLREIEPLNLGPAGC